MIINTIGHFCVELGKNRAVIALAAFAAGAVAAHSIDAIENAAISIVNALEWIGRILMIGG